MMARNERERKRARQSVRACSCAQESERASERERARERRERDCVCVRIVSSSTLICCCCPCPILFLGPATLHWAEGRNVAVKAMHIFGDDILVRNKVEYVLRSLSCVRAHSCIVSLSRARSFFTFAFTFSPLCLSFIYNQHSVSGCANCHVEPRLHVDRPLREIMLFIEKIQKEAQLPTSSPLTPLVSLSLCSQFKHVFGGTASMG